MQFIILAFFFGFIVFAIKGIFAFIIEYSVFFGACAVFIVSYILLLLLNSYIEKWKSSKKSKEELKTTKTSQEKSLSNVDILFKSGYRYDFVKERWEQKLNNKMVAYIGTIKSEHSYSAGFFYGKYDIASKVSFPTVLGAKQWVDINYPILIEEKIEDYLNNNKYNSVFNVRVNNESLSTNKEIVTGKPQFSNEENVTGTSLHGQNKVSENGKYNRGTLSPTPVFTDITVEGDIDDSNWQNEGRFNFEGEMDIDENLFTSSGLSSSQKEPSKKVSPLNHPYIQLSETGKAIYSAMKRFENKTEDSASYCEFFAYYPTYGDMSSRQKKWYFYWRNKVRNNSYPETSLSYIFVYVYELLCGIGTRDKSDGLSKLMAVWKNYRKEYPSLDNYLSEWVFDYCHIHNLPYEPMPFDDNTVLNDIVMNRLVEDHNSEHPLKLPFFLLKSLSDYKITKSKLYKSREQLTRSAIPKVISLADMYFWQKDHKGLLEKFGPGKASTVSKMVYSSTMLTEMSQKYTYKDYVNSKELRDITTGLIKFTENVLRSIEGVSGRVKINGEVQRYIELQTIINKFLYKTYGKKLSVTNTDVKTHSVLNHKPNQPDSLSGLDFDKIEKLRKESDNVREILEVQEEEEVKVLLTDIAGMQLVLANVSEQSRNLIYSLRANGWENRYDPSMQLMVDEVNRIALKYLSQDLLIVDSDSNVAVEEDFWDEIDYIWQSNHTDAVTLPDETNYINDGNDSDNREITKGTIFNYSGLPEELMGCLKSFTSTQEAALVAVLKEDRPYETITALADEAMTMPEVIIDEINEISYGFLNELLIEQDEENLSVTEPYQAMLKKALGMEE